MHSRRPISPSLRFSVYERDKHTCQYCGRRPPEIVLQIDHAYPVALGGDNRIDNLLTACRDCNLGKGARDPGLAMPSRPLTRMEQSVATSWKASEWALYWPGAAWVRALMFLLANTAGQDGWVLVEPSRVATFMWLREDDVRVALDGLERAGAIQRREGDYYEINASRGHEHSEVPWGLGGCFPPPNFQSVAQVYG